MSYFAATSSDHQSQKLWGGRFNALTDPVMDELNNSIGFDKKFYLVDLRGSIAYAKALAKTGIITEEECTQICNGLNEVGKEWEADKFEIKPDDEDIHTANERRLTELIGPVAGKLHTGRSRNDQVATDTRIWLRECSEQLQAKLKKLIETAVKRAENDSDLIMPGYTHLQRAQPIRFSHWLLSYVWHWKDDLERLIQLTDRFNVLPLGCGALAGNPFKVDREFLAQELGFKGIIANSVFAVSDRSYIAEFLFWASLVSIHISQIAEDIILYSSKEFGFLILSDMFSTGSSLMPQKKNPDSMELLRGKSGRVFGNLSGLLMTLKGLPTAYNKDLQEDKEPMFDTADTLNKTLYVMDAVIRTLTIDTEKMQAGLSEDMLATDMADYLVRKGVPFRETHHIVGDVINRSEELECNLSEIPIDQLKELSVHFDEGVKEVASNFELSVNQRDAIGGTSLNQVNYQITLLKDWLKTL
jgi:argininosuccinate lyase